MDLRRGLFSLILRPQRLENSGVDGVCVTGSIMNLKAIIKVDCFCLKGMNLSSTFIVIFMLIPFPKRSLSTTFVFPVLRFLNTKILTQTLPQLSARTSVPPLCSSFVISTSTIDVGARKCTLGRPRPLQPRLESCFSLSLIVRVPYGTLPLVRGDEKEKIASEIEGRSCFISCNYPLSYEKKSKGIISIGQRIGQPSFKICQLMSLKQLETSFQRILPREAQYQDFVFVLENYIWGANR